VERPLSADTDLDAEHVQLELLRRASVGERLRLAFSLSDAVMRMARDALRRLHPGDSDAEHAVRFVAIHYGEELAAGVAARLGVDLRKLRP
jgi:hypothetical protein